MFTATVYIFITDNSVSRFFTLWLQKVKLMEEPARLQGILMYPDIAVQLKASLNAMKIRAQLKYMLAGISCAGCLPLLMNMHYKTWGLLFPNMFYCSCFNEVILFSVYTLQKNFLTVCRPFEGTKVMKSHNQKACHWGTLSKVHRTDLGPCTFNFLGSETKTL